MRTLSTKTVFLFQHLQGLLQAELVLTDAPRLDDVEPGYVFRLNDHFITRVEPVKVPIAHDYVFAMPIAVRLALDSKILCHMMNVRQTTASKLFAAATNWPFILRLEYPRLRREDFESRIASLCQNEYLRFSGDELVYVH